MSFELTLILVLFLLLAIALGYLIFINIQNKKNTEDPKLKIMLDWMRDMKDSVETSVSIKLFSSLNISSYYHIFKSKLFRFPLSKCTELNNFNTARLSNNPDPKDDRPRGQKDLDSDLHHRRIIRQYGQTEPIWIAFKKGEYTLLDGAHRIISTYLENKRSIPTYIIDMDE
jgi:hypothetical protein